MKSKIVNIFFLIIMLVLASLLSFRTDYLFNSDHGFHLSYFVQPIIGMEAGYRLLVDQPSQYGFMNILIPYLIDFNGPTNSFHLFQALLNLITILLVCAISIHALRIKHSNIFIFLFLIILLLSSTDLYGPQVYPSTGVIRFFPVYLLIFTQCYIRNVKTSSKIEIISLGLCLAISMLWGAEALFYVLFSIFFYFIQDLLIATNFKKLKEILVKSTKILIISLITTLLVLKLYQIIFNIDSLNVGLHFSYLISYSYGFGMTLGAMIPNVFTPILTITIPLLVAMIINRENYKSFLTIACYGSIIIAVLSYSFMRSIANNVNNLWPILFLCFSVIYYEIKNKDLLVEKFSLKILLLPSLIISTLCVTNLIVNYKNIPPILKTGEITINQNLLKRNYNLTEDEKIQNAIEKIDKLKGNLSILTWSKLKYNLVKNGGYKPLIPGPPLALISLDSSYLFNLLSKSENYKNKEGFLLYDKEFDTYLDKVLSIIKKTKKCKMIKKTERFELYYCDSHLRSFE